MSILIPQEVDWGYFEGQFEQGHEPHPTADMVGRVGLEGYIHSLEMAHDNGQRLSEDQQWLLREHEELLDLSPYEKG